MIPEALERSPDDGLYDDEDCSRCGGEGWQECDDPIQCTDAHNEWGECPCGARGGSGLAKDQTVW